MSQSIFQAIETNDLPSVNYWIEQGHVNKKHSFYLNPLDHAIRCGNPDIVKCILQSGGISSSILSPLILAVGSDSDDIEILKLLYGYKFDSYDTPIKDVCVTNHIKKLQFLLTNFSLKIDDSLPTGLFYAVINNNADIVKILLDHNADPYKLMDTKTIIDYAQIYYPQMYDIIMDHSIPITKRAN